MDQLFPIKLPPGMRNTGTVYQSKGRWYLGSFVRFFQDTIQPIGGWAARTLTGATISGVPRTMISYQRRAASNPPCIVIGTTRGLYVIVGTVKYDITPAAVTTTITARTWSFDVFGNYLVATDIQSAGAAGRAYYWAGDESAVAVNLPGYWDNSVPPYNTFGVFGTPERFLTALGGPYVAGDALLIVGPPGPRTVMWATQEGGFVAADWTITTTNTAGSYDLTTDGQVVCGRRTRNGSLIFTTTDVWMMTYIGGDFIYRFDQVGARCGIIGHEAVVVNDTATFWMGHNGFYVYDGFVKPLPCDVQDYVFGSVNRTYAHYIWAVENPTFGEITWFYPHAAQTEITRYVTYNFRENHWVTGSLERTCGVAMQPGSGVVPVMCNAAASVFDHETGTARNSEGTPSLESGPIELGDGDRRMQIQKIIPDDKTVGDVNLTVYTAPNPDTAEVSNGPYTLTAQTSIRPLGARQIRVKLTEATASAWRVGTVRLGVVPSSRR